MNSEAQEISGKKDESSSKKAEIAQDSSAKRAGDKMESDTSKKQKTDENEEVEVDNEAELKKHMVTVKDDDIAIDAIPLATKPLVIVEYKLIREGIMGHYQLIRADGSFKRYSSMIRMLQGIDREDLQTLWKLVITKQGDTRHEDEHERVLWGDLKVMFEPDIKSDVWRNLQGYKVTVWKLFDSCGVHFVRFGNAHIFMLVEKRYPLTPITITNMLNKKLQADYWNEMCYQLLKLMEIIGGYHSTILLGSFLTRLFGVVSIVELPDLRLKGLAPIRSILDLLIMINSNDCCFRNLVRDALSATIGYQNSRKSLAVLHIMIYQTYEFTNIIVDVLKNVSGCIIVMSADYAVTYTSAHSEARSWSIPSEDPYGKGGGGGGAHPADALTVVEQAPLLAEDVGPTTSTTQSFLAPRTPPLLPIPLPAPPTSRRADIPEADTPPRKAYPLSLPDLGVRLEYEFCCCCSEKPGPL
ncbi:hypothetical protein Tco_1146230 [Tanacetum coccineum]